MSDEEIRRAARRCQATYWTPNHGRSRAEIDTTISTFTDLSDLACSARFQSRLRDIRFGSCTGQTRDQTDVWLDRAFESSQAAPSISGVWFFLYAYTGV